MNKIKHFKFTDLGIKYDSYWENYNYCRLSKYAKRIIGSGFNLKIALDSAINSITAARYDTSNLKKQIMKQEKWKTIPVSPDTRAIWYDIIENLGALYKDVAYYIMIEWT